MGFSEEPLLEWDHLSGKCPCQPVIRWVRKVIGMSLFVVKRSNEILHAQSVL